MPLGRRRAAGLQRRCPPKSLVFSGNFPIGCGSAAPFWAAESPGHIWSKTLKLTIDQLDQLRDCLAEGARCASESFVAAGLPATQITLRRIGVCALAEFSEGAVCNDGGLIAGAVLRFGGMLSGTALLSLEPEDALAWTQSAGPGRELLSTFVALGSEALSAIVRSATERWQIETHVGEGRLVEDSVVAIMLDTHAPSDTAIVSAGLELRAGDVHVPAYFYLMLEPKPLEYVIGARTQTHAQA